jgi:hypothetical protein
MSTRLPDDPWAGFLEALDSSLTEETTVHCLGGFAIHALYGLARPTRDIDAAAVAPHHQLRLYLGRPEREDLTMRLWVEMIREGRPGE